MVRLEIYNEKEEVEVAYNLEVEAGGTVALSGYHGSSVYELSSHDRVLTVKFTGVSGISDAPKEIKVEQQETEDGVKETESEAMQRVMAEEEAKKNDAKNKKAEPAKASAPAEKVSSKS